MLPKRKFWKNVEIRISHPLLNEGKCIREYSKVRYTVMLSLWVSHVEDVHASRVKERVCQPCESHHDD